MFLGKMVHRRLVGIWNHDDDESYPDFDLDEEEEVGPSLY